MFEEQSEKIFAEELKAKCAKKGCDYETELSKHIALVEAKKAKAEQNHRKAEEKEKAQLEKAEKRRAEKLALREAKLSQVLSFLKASHKKTV